MLEPLRSKSPSPAVRVLLVAEVLVFVGSLAAYLWLALSNGGAVRVLHVVFYIYAGAFPIAMNLLHGDRPADSGIRLDTLKDSAREVGVATAVMVAVLLIAAWIGDAYHWQGWKHFGERAALYVAWGPIQHYWLQAFSVRRMLQARVPAPVAVAVGAAIFGALHAPNWVLVGFTTAAGVTWCILFLRHPNLLTIGVSHGLLALLMYYALPMSWHAGMGVGPMYLKRLAELSGG